MQRLKHTPLLDLRTPLGLIPDAWRISIEPHITRPGPRDAAAGCWLWDPTRTKCSVTSTGEPVVYVRDPETGRTTTLVKFIVAKLFWPEFRRNRHWVYHECGNVNCLAPHHLLVTASAPTQLNVDAIVKKKRVSIRDYQKSLLRREAEAALHDGVEGEIQ